MNSSTPRPPALRRPSLTTRWVLATIGATLAVHHGGLLAGRLADGSLFETPVAVRWSLAVAFLAGLGALRRLGLRLDRPSAVTSLAVLVLLLHLGLAAPSGPPLERGAHGLLAVVPVGLAALGVSAVLGLLGPIRLPQPAGRDRRRRVNLSSPAIRPRLARAVWAARPPPALLGC